MILGWVVIYFANHFPMALSGRFITGIGIGITIPVLTLHLSEIALVKTRGILSMTNYLCQNLGNIFILMIGNNFSLNVVIGVSVLPSISFLGSSFFLPESPMWLVKKGHLSRAKEALLKLRGQNYDYRYEKENNCNYQIPKKYKSDPELGAWVTMVRKIHLEAFRFSARILKK